MLKKAILIKNDEDINDLFVGFSDKFNDRFVETHLNKLVGSGWSYLGM
jgi:hypothetical protein